MNKEQLFMMVFRYEPDPNYRPSEQEIASQKEQWGSFIGNLAISEKLVSTHRLGGEGKKIHADLSITNGIMEAGVQTISGNMVIKAHSLAEATTLAKDCPILTMGGSVEVRSVIPM